MGKRRFVSFAEVNERIGMEEVLCALGIIEQFRQRGSILTGTCPLPAHVHGPRPNRSQFVINVGRRSWHCFGDCGRGGDVVEFVKAMTGLPDVNVGGWFVERFSDRLTDRQGYQRRNPPIDARDRPSAKGTDMAPLPFSLTLDPDVPYLRARGLRPETIRRFGLGLCSFGMLEGYVAIPVHAYPHPANANPVAYLGRWPGDDYEAARRPRYKWPRGFSKGHVVYGLQEALEGPRRTFLVVVEGPFDVFRLSQAGLPNTVAIFGSSLSDTQAAILAQTGRRIVLLFDGDTAGQNGMKRAVEKLGSGTFVRAVFLPSGKDPETMTEREIADIRSWCSH